MSIYYVIVTFHPNFNILNNTLKIIGSKKVIIIDNTRNNLGYASGVNKGIKMALDKKADWIIVLNQDTSITTGAIKYYENKLAHIKSGLVGPCGGILDHNRWSTIYPSQKKCDYISGSFMAISKDVIEKIGKFYEPYFMYYEDVDYCQRALKNNIKLLCLRHPDIRHTDAKDSFLHQYYLARNHLLFVRRQAPIKIKLYEYLHLPKSIWEAIRKKEFGTLYGIRDYLLNRYGKH